ncbi:hypothetical protein C8D92_103294 [Tamilnaduibacter salinus]|uniref:Patatin-like phospholipase family protein n=1 Tax=Tamilnaduibacter salinus TaxID=1484056 RepID=A0A2A2I5Y1_9GAMM|nr:patatin-like phospholipase family protein [Tamilnaduibacter salinus]PAV27057.1 hypothetical protein CF392_02660 [Tamilnaduibacter salinus]PVY77607.1 hypothetical protein C8D92_103294 [Tamilnaduibacter salinus]
MAALTIRAGQRALDRIRERGLSPSDVHVIPGAAGGPKALGITGLDQAIFGEWLPRAPQVRSLIGSSIGSWRFAALMSGDPVRQLERLAELYTVQSFGPNETAAEVTEKSIRFLETLLGEGARDVLNHPDYRLNILIVRSLGLLERDTPRGLSLGLMTTVGANLAGRRFLRPLMERGIVQDERLAPPTEELTDFRTHHIPLTEENLLPSLLASASIPMVMSGVSGIPGAPEGLYRDGGLLDYHLDLPWRQPGIVLYPHFTDRVVPGWFDKALSWRKPNPEHMQDVVLVAPSEEYIDALPDRKIPDRKDFKRYMGDDETRQAHWREATAESRKLGDEFLDLVDSGRIRDVVQPL